MEAGPQKRPLPDAAGSAPDAAAEAAPEAVAERQHAEEHEHIEAQEAYIRQVAGGSPADQIARAKQLLADGTITEPEFAELKQQALGHFGGRHAAA